MDYRSGGLLRCLSGVRVIATMISPIGICRLGANLPEYGMVPTKERSDREQLTKGGFPNVAIEFDISSVPISNLGLCERINIFI